MRLLYPKDEIVDIKLFSLNYHEIYSVNIDANFTAKVDDLIFRTMNFVTLA